jgi:hypothetical protein
MRRALIVGLAGLAALAACHKRSQDAPRAPARPGAPPAAGAAAQAGPPARKPGMWEQTVTSAGRTQTTRVCLDPVVEQRFTWWGQHTAKGECSDVKVTPRAGGGWNFASSCDRGAKGKVETHGSATGDFAKAYKVTAESTTYDAPPDMTGTHRMTLEAYWQGPCPPTLRPGDVLLPGGLKINMLAMPER